MTVGLEESKEKSTRDNIDNNQFFREYMTINEAHEYNKNYMQKASKRQLNVRRFIWSWQYWLLIGSMILMYPTPLMNKLEAMEYNNTFNTVLNKTLSNSSMDLPPNFEQPNQTS